MNEDCELKVGYVYLKKQSDVLETPQKTRGEAAVNTLAGSSDGPGFQPTGFERSWRNRGTLENEREEDQMGSGNNLEKGCSL